MGTLKNKIDFEMLISVNMANANGDPLETGREQIIMVLVRYPTYVLKERYVTACRIWVTRYLCSQMTEQTMVSSR